MSEHVRNLDRGRFAELYMGLGGPGAITEDPLPGIRRFAWTAAADIERHAQFGADENHLEGKIPTYTGEVQVEDGDALTTFLQYATGDPNLIEIDMYKMQVGQPWIWCNLLDRRRTEVRHSTLVKRAFWSGEPNEFDVDDTAILSFPFEAPRAWKIRGYAVKGEEFTGDGQTTVFNLAETAVQNSEGSYAFVVALEENCAVGIMQELEDGLTVTASTLTFDDPPCTGKSVQIIYIYDGTCPDTCS
jgi:hypothetical protein